MSVILHPIYGVYRDYKVNPLDKSAPDTHDAPVPAWD
jgi:hypothetical protein